MHGTMLTRRMQRVRNARIRVPITCKYKFGLPTSPVLFFIAVAMRNAITSGERDDRLISICIFTNAHIILQYYTLKINQVVLRPS